MRVRRRGGAAWTEAGWRATCWLPSATRCTAPPSPLRSWGTPGPCDGNHSSWYGVSCHGNDSVQGLQLERLGLAGGAPDMGPLTVLPGLGVISLSGNALTGTFPNVSALGVLKMLYLSRNKFSGVIPAHTFMHMRGLRTSRPMSSPVTCRAPLHRRGTGKGAVHGGCEQRAERGTESMHGWEKTTLFCIGGAAIGPRFVLSKVQLVRHFGSSPSVAYTRSQFPVARYLRIKAGWTARIGRVRPHDRGKTAPLVRHFGSSLSVAYTRSQFPVARYLWIKAGWTARIGRVRPHGCGKTAPTGLCVFSSRTGQWSVLPEAKCGKSLMPILRGVGDPAHANGCVYWVMDDESEAYLLVLDTRTKKFSTSVRLLASMREQYHGNMRVMRSEDGELRIVAMAWKSFALHVWLLDRSRSTKGRWVREQVRELGTFQGVFELVADVRGGSIRIMDAGEGAVFFKRFGSDWVYAVNLEERSVLKLPHEKFSSGPALPYRMALCPPLPNQAQGQDG